MSISIESAGGGGEDEGMGGVIMGTSAEAMRIRPKSKER